MPKVVLVVNGKESDVGEFESLQQVAVSGPTGVASYRLDPLQDHLVKIIVDANPEVLVRPEAEVQAEKEAAKAAAKK